MIRIGSHVLPSPTVLAPMAGVTDLPFRQLCRQMGAGLVVSEMVTSDTSLWNSRKSSFRLIFDGEPSPRSVQIAGSEPEMMAQAARQNVELGAEIIDINMGCPAKKVCKKAAGSALLRDEALVEAILKATVQAVDVPVTLKIRTGWSNELRNAVTIARIAEDCGVAALAVHGRSRACKFQGHAEYDTIAEVVKAVSIPVFANGDITSPQQAKAVLDHTNAAAVMIGRAAQGRPWIFREINHYLATGNLLPAPEIDEIRAILFGHVHSLHQFYGSYLGTRIARKHTGWYLATCRDGKALSKQFNQLTEPQQQLDYIQSIDITMPLKEHAA